MKRVYFIKPIGMAGPVKIGCSASPDHRRSTLEQWSPFPLEIVAEIEGSFDLERRFHVRFRDSAKTREWFDITPELQAAIDSINAGTFDIATLPESGAIKDYRKPRNLTFITPAFCFAGSVRGRVQHLTRKRRVVCWTEVQRAIPELTRGRYEALLARRAEVEALIAEWSKRSPTTPAASAVAAA